MCVDTDPYFAVAPTFQTDVVKKVVDVGNDVEFVCGASGNPKPTVTWIINGENKNQNNAEYLCDGVNK